ncbi:MAG TPA: hypothetical protein PK367_02830 [Candidatus Paceibacterota bacterium]|nr:hypothetical protein [Candidatus Paceibacterota bacterium]
MLRQTVVIVINEDENEVVYHLTPEEFEELVRLIGKYTESHKRVCRECVDAYEIPGDDSMSECRPMTNTAQIADFRLKQLADIFNHCEVFDPLEQSEVVRLGTGVILEGYVRGEFLMTDCILDESAQRISSKSEIGKALLGMQAGETARVLIGGENVCIYIVSIIPPSRARRRIEINNS